MPLEVGFIPAGSPSPENGIAVPGGLPTNTIDVLISAPKTISVLYAALTVEGRSEEADLVANIWSVVVDLLFLPSQKISMVIAVQQLVALSVMSIGHAFSAMSLEIFLSFHS